MSVGSRVESVASYTSNVDIRTVERSLWISAFLLYGLGDVVTTSTVLALGGVESNASVVPFIEVFGSLGLLIHKSLIMLVPIGTYYLLKKVGALSGIPYSPFQSLILAIFTVRGALIVGWNIYIIYLLMLPGGAPAVDPPI